MGQTLNSDSKEMSSCSTECKENTKEENLKNTTQDNQKYVQIANENTTENSSVSDIFRMYWNEAKEVWQSSKKMTFLDFFNMDCSPSDFANDLIFPDTH